MEDIIIDMKDTVNMLCPPFLLMASLCIKLQMYAIKFSKRKAKKIKNKNLIDLIYYIENKYIA